MASPTNLAHLAPADSPGVSGETAQTIRGRVMIAPEASTDSLVACSLAIGPSDAYVVPAGQWQTGGGTLPLAGALCLISLDDYGDAWVAVAVGTAGGGGAETTAQVFTFSTPEATWTCVHNLGRYPIISAYDTTGQYRPLVQIENPDLNTTVLTLNPPLAGKVVLT
jgi:hypothetical protein